MHRKLNYKRKNEMSFYIRNTNMIPQSILSEIMVYLNLPELLEVRIVNKRFYNACKSPFLFRREFISMWMTSTDTSTQASSNWQSLCLEGIRAKVYWQNLSDEIFTNQELRILYDELVSTLASPIPIFPVMRRDIFCMPTLIQDLLANPDDQFIIDSELEQYSEAIAIYLQENSEELFYQTHTNDLIALRWNTRKSNERDSIGSESTQCSEDFNDSLLIVLIKAIKKVVKIYCKAASQLLLESSSILTAYANAWESYSFAIKKINSLFLPVTELINEFYENNYGNNNNTPPRINMMKILLSIWRRRVFEPCKEKILSQVINELNQIRETSIEKLYWAESRRIVEGLLDLSLNELSVFFKQHSLLTVEGPYSYLHYGVIEKLKEFYNDFPVVFEKEQEILSGIFIPATVREARRNYCDIIGKKFKNQELITESLNYEKNEDDLMIEWTAQNYGIPVDDFDIFKRFSQFKENKFCDIVVQLHDYNMCIDSQA
ncbi:hypothetical protein SteCoe_22671 [Stentor coeruleus]|uniref:F-box domain-containing protein n=1 Tax=Stentor coeruleus TaxID=5963 RepID=A0A1R2BLS3_9CILI|nr:hypothetical protein SteCoe_22671 [Stentor coeruleus]